MACLSASDLAGFAGGAVPGAAEQAHLFSCADCRARLMNALREEAATTLTVDGDAPSSPEAGREVPLSHARYSLEVEGGRRELGRGGYGKVLLARDLPLGRDVALKCLRSSVVQSGKRGQAEARLLREARVVGQLEHPGIVPLYDLGRTAEGQLFYTMRRIRGRTLADAVESSRDLAERLRLLPHVLAACHAVAYAHSRGVVHRDLKPANVMVDRFGQTAVIDWGLASARNVEGPDEVDDAGDDAVRLVGGGETLSDGRGRLGTPAYMSPEQLSGDRALIDERSDVWGLGAMLFEVLTARSPREEGPLTTPPPPVRTVLPECPPDLAALCDKALAESRDARYQSAEALAADLDAWLHGQRVTAHTYRPRELLRRFVTEHRRALAVALVAVLSLVAVGAASFVRVREERNRAREFGLALLDDVLPRMTSLGDPHFLTSFTLRVQEWLESSAGDVDDAAVARAWLRLALNAETVGDTKAATRFAQRCVLIARTRPARERFALEQACEVVIGDGQDLSLAGHAELIERLWVRPRPPSDVDDVLTLEAQQLVATRRVWYANSLGNGEVERDAVAGAVALARRWVTLAPDEPAARLALADALTLESVVASNRHDATAALAASADSVRSARALVDGTRTMLALSKLANALLTDAVVRRWNAPGETAALDEVVAEAARVHEALLVLAPRNPPALVGLLALHLEHAQFEALPRVLELCDVDAFTAEGRDTWLFAMLALGRSQVVLEKRAWVDSAQTFDTLLAFAIAAAEQGDRATAARWARAAATQPPASGWPIDGMTRWAKEHRGPLAETFQRLARDLSAAQLAVDDAALAQAATSFADALAAN